MNKYIIHPKDYKKLKEAYDFAVKVNELYVSHEIDEREYFHQIFGERCGEIVNKMIPTFAPYIPDASYEDDADAFYYPFKNLFENYLIVL